MKKYFFMALAIILPFVASAQTTTWASDPAHSRLGFTVKHLSVAEISGYFGDFQTTVSYAKADMSDMKVKVTAKVSSVNTGIEMRDNHLKSADFFDAEKYPDLTFVSTSFKKVDDKHGKLVGELTFHGVTKPITLDVTYYGTVTNPMNSNETAGFKITGKVNRQDYGVGTGFADNFISDTVHIVADAEFSPVK